MKIHPVKNSLFFFTLTSIVCVFLLNSTASAANPEHLFWAEDIAANVTPDKNMYDSSPSYINWPDSNGIGLYENHTKCASFVTNVLMQSYGWSSDYFKGWTGSTSPTAEKYFDTIQQKNGFVAITNIKNLQPGDIIAIKYPNNLSVTGHMMIANSYPLLRTPTSPIVKATSQYEIEIIDSSQTGHGPKDTRLMEDGTYSPGAGIGIIRLYTDNTGAIKGYTWSTYMNSQYYDLTNRPIIVGRLI